MAELRPLRPRGEGDQSAESPEALLISAMLETGEFTPERYHVGADDVEAWRKLFDFCVEHQKIAGDAPALSLVRRRFPEFELTPDVDPAWAANLVARASSARALRTRTRDALLALGEEDIEGAYAAFEGMAPPRTARREPVSVFDHSVLEEAFEISRIEVPYQSLGRATGGIAPSEFWLIGARLGSGKTYEALKYAGRAAQTAHNVGVISLEMPAWEVGDRAAKILCGHDTELFMQLESSDVYERKRALDTLRDRVPGNIEVVDPSHGDVASVSTLREACEDYDLVIVDHVGLLKTADGRRAIDDWRVMALISNTIRELTLASGTPVLGITQLNREAENASQRAPKPSTISQADALGQDANVIVLMKRLSARVLVQEAVKVRSGPNVKWWSRFDPANNRWDEMTKEEAAGLGMLDEDARSEI